MKAVLNFRQYSRSNKDTHRIDGFIYDKKLTFLFLAFKTHFIVVLIQFPSFKWEKTACNLRLLHALFVQLRSGLVRVVCESQRQQEASTHGQIR